MKKDYTQSVSMICPTCGGTQFSFEQDESPIQCVGCDRIFTRDELIHENDVQVEMAVDDIKKEVMKDLIQDLRSVFGKLK